jgi:RecB family endonuclease NucS
MPLRIREQQLENLLADHPDDFFPDRQFRLIGRQTSFAGVGRFDLLFEDHAERKWLIELKAVPLKITDTDQLMRYHDEIHESAHSSGLVPCFGPRISRPMCGHISMAKGLSIERSRSPNSSELQLLMAYA